MMIVDLTHTISPNMPVYPGTEPPLLNQANTIERDGFAEKLISMCSHTGTHIDAPAHMLAAGETLDQFDTTRFVGRGCVIDVSDEQSPVIRPEIVALHAEEIARSEFVLFHTGWSRHWGQDCYFNGFPVLSPEATLQLSRRGLKGIGFDVISADSVGSTEFENHLVLFRAGLILIENLTGLDALIGKSFLFSCLPLKLEGADGSPVRAVAILDAP